MDSFELTYLSNWKISKIMKKMKIPFFKITSVNIYLEIEEKKNIFEKTVNE